MPHWETFYKKAYVFRNFNKFYIYQSMECWCKTQFIFAYFLVFSRNWWFIRVKKKSGEKHLYVLESTMCVFGKRKFMKNKISGDKFYSHFCSMLSLSGLWLLKLGILNIQRAKFCSELCTFYICLWSVCYFG